MKKINRTTAEAEVQMGTAIIVDVRETTEYEEGHLPSAINLPASAFNAAQFAPYKEQTICLLCHSGKRACLIAEKLKQIGFQDIVIMDEQMQDIGIQSAFRSKGWAVDRQFRMILGVLLAVFLIGYFSVSEKFLIIPIILCVGLTFTSLIDRCYMRMAIAMLPWNRKR